MKRVNTFVDINTELVKGSKTKVEGSSKRADDELEQEKAKKQKGNDDQEEAEMKRHIEIVKHDEVAIDAIPLATKHPVIVDYKIDKDGRMGYFKLIRAYGSSKRYSSMIKMLQGIDKEDLETLWKLVKAKHENIRPEDDYERVLWGYLKVMFEPDIKSKVVHDKNSPDLNLLSDQEYSEEEEAKAMAETMEQYMSKTRTDYRSGVVRPKIDNKDQFELKGKFLKKLRENTFSSSNNEDANEHIEKVLEIVDLFHVPNITVDQLMLRVFPISLTGATSRWLRNEPTGSIKTWEDLKTKFLNKYCPPGRTAKKMEEINILKPFFKHGSALKNS
ncbi:retrovirus-related pol polyprotein from transposon TNT 1-94 [Tanacetum coccineum]